MQRAATIGRVEEGLLEGPAWWCPWLALFATGLAAGATLFVPAIRSFWILPLLGLLAVGTVGAWRGFIRGNSAQRAASLLGILLILGFSGLLAKTFFADELAQGVSSATSTTGTTDY